MSAKSLVVSVILYVMGRVRSRARGGDPISNAKHYIEILSNALRSAGIDPDQVSNLLGSQEVLRYIGVAIGGSVVDQGECDVNKPLRVPFIKREVSVGPALLMNVVINGARARDDYVKIVNELDRHMESLGGLRLDWEALITTLLSIAKSTLVYVPYSTCGNGNTYSAYTVAHAAAAYASTTISKDKYAIVVADIVGIQDMISRINRTEKAMRQLKGRSILVNLLQHTIATRFIRDTNRKLGVDTLSPVNVLVDTGGEVVMLIPAIDEDVLNGVIEEIEDEVVREFESRVRVVVAHSRVHNIVDDFGGVLREAYGGRDNRRYGKWKKFIINGKDLCDMCHMPTERPSHVDNQTLCPFCALAHRIGGVSRRLGMLAEVANPVNQPGCESIGIGINYVVCLEGVRLGTVPRIIYDLNRLSINNAINAGHALFFLNTRMPTDEFGELKSFEDLGSVAVTIKSDANKMGDLKREASKLGAAQYVLYSQLLITIFDVYGAMLYMNTPNYSDSVFIIYSGGDDLVVVSNHYALDYLVRIVRRANEFGINVAGGAMVHDVKLPIYLVWRYTEERLNSAKDMGRDKSLVYLLNTGKSPVILSIDRVRDVISYIEQKHAWTGELEDEEGEASRTLMYKVTIHLTRMYDLLWEMRGVLRDENRSKDLTRLNELRRDLVHEVINYVYLINRNGRNAQGMLNELPKNLHPSNVADTLAPILRDQDNRQETLKALDGLLNDLGIVVARINLYRQLLEKQQTMPA